MVLALLAAGCASPDGGGTGATPDPGAEAIRLAAVGDSITEADSPDFAAGQVGEESWVRYVVGEDVALVGGWARWGATTAEMADHAEPEDADVLVVLAGTNDLGHTPHATTTDHIRDVVGTVGADDVVLASVPPLDHSPQAAAELNASLEELADAEDWQWVDAAAEVRTAEGRFADGMTSDGVHPTRDGARALGGAIREAVLDVADAS